MHILVTGATGFLGSRLVEHLLERESDLEILATGRKFSSNNKIEDSRVTYVLGDLSDQAFVSSLIEDSIDIVINCASLSSPWGSNAAFYQANVQTQSLLIEQSKKSRIKRFIYISSPSIYFDFNDSLNITEEDSLPKNMVNAYARTKYQAEEMLRKSNLPHIILRPRALIGRGDTVIMPRLIRSHQEKRLKIMGDGNNLVDLTSVSNMAEAIRLSISTSNYNETYNISNGEPVSLWDSINSVLVAIDLPKITRKVPYWLLYSFASFMEIKANISKGNQEPILTKYGVGVLAKSFTFDITKARTKLGYVPSQSTREGIEEFAHWYKNSN